jgi:hypothetical protein
MSVVEVVAVMGLSVLISSCGPERASADRLAIA